ncbi:hypothetical protein A2U01_0115234, partial [Trifolium medium]|nr:hypothetical protein [Trifolium medium]
VMNLFPVVGQSYAAEEDPARRHGSEDDGAKWRKK